MIKEFQEPKKLIIPEAKLLNYCLNKEDKIGKAKAIAFEKYLGYTRENQKELDNLIRENILKAKIKERPADKYGRTFSAEFYVSSLGKNKILMVTGWKLGADDEFPRLTSAYVKPEKRGKNED